MLDSHNQGREAVTHQLSTDMEALNGRASVMLVSGRGMKRKLDTVGVRVSLPCSCGGWRIQAQVSDHNEISPDAMQ